jgi:hypothetical protein
VLVDAALSGLRKSLRREDRFGYREGRTLLSVTTGVSGSASVRAASMTDDRRAVLEAPVVAEIARGDVAVCVVPARAG